VDASSLDESVSALMEQTRDGMLPSVAQAADLIVCGAELSYRVDFAA
jgi:hypothetical protein